MCKQPRLLSQIDIRSFSLHVVTQRRPCGLHWFQQCETIPQGQVLVHLAAWAEGVKVSLSQVPPPVVSRGIAVDQTFTELCDILWNSANQVHGRARSSHRRTRPRWWNDVCFQALVARNGAWRDYRRSGSATDYARFSQCGLHFHRVVRSTKRKFWYDWQEQFAQFLAFAPIESEVAFVSPSNVLFPMNLWNGAPIPFHLARVAVPPIFAPSGGTTSRKSFRAKMRSLTQFSVHIVLTKPQASSTLLSQSLSSFGLSCSARTLPQVVMVSRFPSSRLIWIGGGALCWIFSTSCSHEMPFLQHGSPARLFQSSNTEIGQILTITDRLAHSRCSNTSFMGAMGLIPSLALKRPKVVSDGVPMRFCRF